MVVVYPTQNATRAIIEDFKIAEKERKHPAKLNTHSQSKRAIK